MRRYTASRSIECVAPAGDGFAVLTAAGIEIVDRELRLVEIIAGDHDGHVIQALADGRWVVGASTHGPIHVGRRGGPLVAVPQLEFAMPPFPTRDGYVAFVAETMWVERNGVLHAIAMPFFARAAAVWGPYVVAARRDRFCVVDASGSIVATIDQATNDDTPRAVGDWLAITGEAEHVIYGRDLRVVARVPGGYLGSPVVRIGDLLVVGYPTPTAWHIPTLTQRWKLAGEIYDLIAIGEHVVIGGWRHVVSVVDARGELVGELALPERVDALVPFDGGVAIATYDHSELWWWRPGTEPQLIAHDLATPAIADVSTALVAWDREHLRVWLPSQPSA